MKKYISPEIKALLARKLKLGSSEPANELDILKLVPRYTETNATINGVEWQMPDSASFLSMYYEIFRKEIYKFSAKNETPYIIDGGANIGVASIYFKQLYPKAEIIAFEPDRLIFEYLESNIKSLGLELITLVNKGLWNTETVLKFKVEGADAGLLEDVDNYENANFQNVSVISLKQYLHKPVDFLKLDIEGAETVVLRDIAANLNNVERIFIEYHSFVGQEQSLNEIINILKGANFRLYISSPGLSSVSPFSEITVYKRMDMQLNIYGIKEHK
jgi:FkbM family methyltransferase